MTVYTGVLNRYRVTQVKTEYGHLRRLNLILAEMAVVVVIIYVFLSNLLVSQKYSLILHKEELNQLNAKLLMQKHESDYGMEGLLIFARKSGLIEAKDSSSILRNDGFAILNQ